MKRLSLLIMMLLIGGIVTPDTTCHAINFAAGIKRKDGPLLNLYPFWYSANKLTDKKGGTAVDNLGFEKYGVYVSGSYYLNGYFFNTVIPVGKIEVNAAGGKDEGLGDLQLRFGHFLQFPIGTFLPLLMLKTPTGSYDKSRPTNFGDGQTDLSAEIYFQNIYGALSLDCMTRYTVRFRNPVSDVTPGNEFVFEGLSTWKFADNIRIGPAVNFITGGDRKNGGKTVADSGLTRLSVGGEFFYGLSPHYKISLAAFQDIVSHNTTEGFLLMSRIVIPF